MSLAREVKQALDNVTTLRLVPFVVTDDSPLEVTIEGGSHALPARAIAGQTLSIGDTGLALWQPPILLCLETI